jgi:hypothetical protein
MLTSGDARGVWNAAAGSACNEFCELCALSFALPGIFGFFLSRLGCLGSFEGSVDCTGPIVGDLAKKFFADWEIFLSFVGCWIAGAATPLLAASPPTGLTAEVVASLVRSALLLTGFASVFDGGSTGLRDGVPTCDDKPSPPSLGTIVVGEPSITDVGVDGSAGL